MTTTPLAGTKPRRSSSVWALAWEVSQWRPRQFWSAAIAWVIFYINPVVFGWAVGKAFGAIESGDRTQALWWGLAVIGVQLVQAVNLIIGVWLFSRIWILMEGLLQGNMLAGQVANGRPDAGPPVASAGESITRFRDDTHDVVWFIDSWLDVAGGASFTIGAVSLMVAIDATTTALVLIPMASIGVVTLLLDRKVKEYRRDDREATVAVTGFLGDVLAASTSVKVADGADHIVHQLNTLTDRRRDTAIRDRVLTETIGAWGVGATDVAYATVILASATALATGEMGLGELAVFVGLLFHLATLPRMTGRMLARRKQGQVAFDGMRQLVADTDPRMVTVHRDLPIGERRPITRPDRDRIPLDRLDAEDLAVRYSSTDGGFGPISFSLERGSFTVVTGPVGSGKSTLLRAVVGLVYAPAGDELVVMSGRVRWNGLEVADRAAFFQPPQAAYLSQVPQLLSDSVADNILLGLDDADGALEQAVALAAVDDDIAEMPDGLGTRIGPRGLRLSGGQRQRVAAARALVHTPELVVLDDISSALDVETEVRLWTNLAAAGATVLAVSHRPIAFDRADQIIRL